MLFVRNFMWLASAATASTCCSVDSSSAQKISAAFNRRSGDILFQIRVGRNALRSFSIAFDHTRTILGANIERVPDRLFTPRFFVMCGYSFTVFLSAFQLFPTAPFHIIDLGGSTAASGLFLGFLTYSSALSAPLTGAYADRVGTRRWLIGCSLALVVFSLLYAVITSVTVLLALVVLHGIFWSGLLSASAAYMTSLLPESRRAEGIGY